MPGNNSTPQFQRLLNAIRMVESSDGKFVYGDWLPGKDRGDTNNARAWGPYQLHKVYVDDANRIGKTKYSYQDRLNEAKSRDMMTNYLKFYGGRVSSNPTDEIYARIHNGGPKGHTSPRTIGYWNKVQQALKAIDRRTAQQQQQQQTVAPAAPRTVPAVAAPARPVVQPAAAPAAQAIKVPAPVTQQPAIQPVTAQPVTSRSAVTPQPVTARPVAAPVKVFKKGDTLWKLWKNRLDKSVSWGKFVQDFQKNNPGLNIDKLTPGVQYK